MTQLQRALKELSETKDNQLRDALTNLIDIEEIFRENPYIVVDCTCEYDGFDKIDGQKCCSCMLKEKLYYLNAVINLDKHLAR